METTTEIYVMFLSGALVLTYIAACYTVFKMSATVHKLSEENMPIPDNKILLACIFLLYFPLCTIVYLTEKEE